MGQEIEENKDKEITADQQNDMLIQNLRDNITRLSQDKLIANSILDSISNSLIDLLTLVKNQKTVLNMAHEDRIKLAQQQQQQQQQR